MKDRNFLNSLCKGLKTLQTLGRSNIPLTLSEIAGSIGTTKTTATRLCHTLREMGFIQRDENKKYSLTLEVLTLGYSAICGLEWREMADRYLKAFFERIGENVNLGILDGQQVLHLIRYRKQEHLPFAFRIGMKLPVYCTAIGKVLVAINSPKITKAILEKLQFRPLTPHTITTIEKFRLELEGIRSKGYAISREEFSIGNCAVAAPVLNKDNYAAAAINVAVSTQEYSPKDVEKIFGPQVIEVAGQISKALGAVESNIVR